VLKSIAIKERAASVSADAAAADAGKLLRTKEPSDALSIVFNQSWVKLGGLVGEGAFSRVYEGVYTDPRTSESRPVAVKILKKSMLKRKSDCLRFIKEAKVMSRLSHRWACHLWLSLPQPLEKLARLGGQQQRARDGWIRGTAAAGVAQRRAAAQIPGLPPIAQAGSAPDLPTGTARWPAASLQRPGDTAAARPAGSLHRCRAAGRATHASAGPTAATGGSPPTLPAQPHTPRPTPLAPPQPRRSIVGCHGIGKYDDACEAHGGSLFIVQEVVRGGNLLHKVSAAGGEEGEREMGEARGERGGRCLAAADRGQVVRQRVATSCRPTWWRVPKAQVPFSCLAAFGHLRKGAAPRTRLLLRCPT
jgi:serine/threonine protein kinase